MGYVFEGGGGVGHWSDGDGGSDGIGTEIYSFRIPAYPRHLTLGMLSLVKV